jgi:hypothetical protein
MIDYKYNKIVQHGGGLFMKLFFFVIVICVICCCSCACCSWPYDLDTFAWGIFKGLKIDNPFKGMFSGFSDVFKGITNPAGEIGKLFKI